MARYGAAGIITAVNTGFKTAMNLHAPASAMRRAKLYEFDIGCNASPPADNTILFQILRATTVGTMTNVVPETLDPADAASATQMGKDATVEPTTTGLPLLAFSFNQRATYRWVAAPNGELIVPAVANAGLALQFNSPAYAGIAGGSLAFEE